MTDIAVLGVGAIGGTVAAYLSDGPGHAVTLCVRSAVSELTIETPEGRRSVSPSVWTAPGQGRPVDWLLVATKAYDVAGAAPWFARVVGPQTRVAVLQNGVEHVARFAPYVAPSRIVPVVVDMPVERLGPGRFHQRLKGRLTVPADAAGEDFAGLFRDTGIDVKTTPDFLSEAWRKLALNCPGAVSALLLKPASIVRSAPIAAIMRELVDECIAVARAEGAVFDADLGDQIMERCRSGPPDAINSLHADRLAGKTLEIDARNGAVVRLGQKHGIPTPANRIIVGLLEGG